MVPSDFIQQLLIGRADLPNAWEPSVGIGPQSAFDYISFGDFIREPDFMLSARGLHTNGGVTNRLTDWTV
jgi:hypothetical protein